VNLGTVSAAAVGVSINDTYSFGCVPTEIAPGEHTSTTQSGLLGGTPTAKGSWVDGGGTHYGPPYGVGADGGIVYIFPS
jgi:hypothetical protein